MKDKQDEKMFDDAIRSRLASAAEEVPGHLWTNISAKSRKRKGLLWFFGSVTGFLFQDVLMAALLVFVSTAGSSFSDTQNGSNDDNKNAATVSVKNEIVNTENPPPDDKSYQLNAERNTKENGALSITSSKNNESEKVFSKNSDNIQKQSNTNKESGKSFTALEERHSGEKVNDAQRKMLKNKQSKSTSVDDNQIVYVDLIESPAAASREMIHPLVLRKNVLIDQQVKNDELTSEILNPIQRPSSFPVSIRLGAGSLFNKSEINSASKISNSTTDWFNKSFAFAIADVNISRNWILSAGIQQQQSEATISITDVVPFDYLDIDTLTGYIIHPFNPPVPYTYFDTSLVSSSIEKVYAGSVDVKFTTVTFQVEHTLHKKAFNLRSGVGVGVNVSSVADGNLVLKNAETEETLSMKDMFKGKTGISFLASVEAGYYIGGRFEPFIRVQYNRSGNLTKDNSILNYKNQTIGAGLGLRIQLTR